MLIDLLGIFPRGFYLDELINVTRGELHWECDYNREAAYQKKYRECISVASDKFYAPKVIDELST